MEPLGHIEVIDETVEPTCTETGLTEGKHCERCNEVLVKQEVVEALGHSYDAVVADPTCETQGYTTYTCHCGDTYVSDYVEAHGHNYEIAEHVDATCENEGHTTYVCSHDSTHTYTDTHEALGHIEVIDSRVELTCTETGLTEGTHCERCNEVLVAQEVIEALGHTYSEYITNEDGHYQICDKCNHQTELEKHEFIDGICNVCGYKKQVKKIILFVSGGAGILSSIIAVIFVLLKLKKKVV